MSHIVPHTMPHILGDFPTEPESLIVFSVIMFANALAMAASAAYVARRVHLHAGCEAPSLIQRTVFHSVAGSAATAVSILMAYLQDPLVGALAWTLVPLSLAVHHVRTTAAPAHLTVDAAQMKREGGRCSQQGGSWVASAPVRHDRRARGR